MRKIKDKAKNFMKVVSALQYVTKSRDNIAKKDRPDSEMVNLRQLYHGTHDNLKALVPRPISNLDTFGTWLSDYKSATHYGPIVHRINSDKTVKLASYYDLDELFGGPWKEIYKDSSKLKSLKKDLQRQGYDGVKLSYLDGDSGYFVCLWHGDTIPVEVITKTKMIAASKKLTWKRDTSVELKYQGETYPLIANTPDGQYRITKESGSYYKARFIKNGQTVGDQVGVGTPLLSQAKLNCERDYLKV